MRCGCPHCGSYMIQSESMNLGCVCQECLYRCRACMGTNTVVRREDLGKLHFTDYSQQAPQEDEDEERLCAPLRDEDFID